MGWLSRFEGLLRAPTVLIMKTLQGKSPQQLCYGQWTGHRSCLPGHYHHHHQHHHHHHHHNQHHNHQVGGAVSWRSAGLFPPIITCCAIPVFLVMKVGTIVVIIITKYPEGLHRHNDKPYSFQESPVYLLKTKGEALESLQSYRTINTDKERCC